MPIPRPESGREVQVEVVSSSYSFAGDVDSVVPRFVTWRSSACQLPVAIVIS